MSEGYANGTKYTSYCPFCNSRDSDDEDPAELDLLDEDTDMNEYEHTRLYKCSKCGKVHVEIFTWKGWEEVNENHPQWGYYKGLLNLKEKET